MQAQQETEVKIQRWKSNPTQSVCLKDNRAAKYFHINKAACFSSVQTNVSCIFIIPVHTTSINGTLTAQVLSCVLFLDG